MLIRKWPLAVMAILALVLSFNGIVTAADDNDRKAYLTQLGEQMQSSAMHGVLPMDNMAQIYADLDVVEGWARLLNQASHFQFTVEEYATVTAFKTQARTAQGKLFPMLRRAMAHCLPQELAAIKVAVTGDNDTEIRFTSLELRDMALTQKIHDNYVLLFKRLRFRQAVFMLDHEDISTLSSFQPPQDEALVLWDAAYQHYALFN